MVHVKKKKKNFKKLVGKNKHLLYLVICIKSYKFRNNMIFFLIPEGFYSKKSWTI